MFKKIRQRRAHKKHIKEQINKAFEQITEEQKRSEEAMNEFLQDIREMIKNERRKSITNNQK